MKDEMNINSLSRKSIKENHIQYLNQTNRYTDYDFKASGISIILDMFANHGHLIGLYTKFGLDERFTQSTKTMEGIRAHCESKNYIPNGRKCAEAEFKLDIYIEKQYEPDRGFVTIDKGSKISATNEVSDTRVFNILEDINIYNKRYEDDFVIYTSDTFIAYEGVPAVWKFEVDYGIEHQSFTIKDKNIDLNTLKVFVKDDIESTQRVEYKLSRNIINNTKDDNIFYVIVNPNGYYEFYFGDNLIGNRPKNKSVVECEYVITNGLMGNGAVRYKFESNKNGNGDIINNYKIVSSTQSHGGKNEDDIERIRYLLKNYEREQNRIVNIGDYKTEIFDKYGNIESINVWGGEDNYIKQYGKTFISAKPKHSDKLTSTAKKNIVDNIIKAKAIVGADCIFVDPEFLDVDVSVYAVVDRSLTQLPLVTIESQIEHNVNDYNENELGGFRNILSNIDLLNYIKTNSTKYISTLYTKKTFKKTMEVIQGSTNGYNAIFGNPVDTSEKIESSPFDYGTSKNNYRKVKFKYIRDKKGIFLVDANTEELIFNMMYGTLETPDTNAVIKFTLPDLAKFNSMAIYSNVGLITWSATPSKPDIFTYNNNIVRINNIKAYVNPLGDQDQIYVFPEG